MVIVSKLLNYAERSCLLWHIRPDGLCEFFYIITIYNNNDDIIFLYLYTYVLQVGCPPQDFKKREQLQQNFPTVTVRIPDLGLELS